MLTRRRERQAGGMNLAGFFRGRTKRTKRTKLISSGVFGNRSRGVRSFGSRSVTIR